jgi:diketogulonate reductase-like aldo/keto reductase
VETFAAFEELLDEGKILSFGVSNFDVPDLVDAREIAGEGAIACNQVLYHLHSRIPAHSEERRGFLQDVAKFCHFLLPCFAFNPIRLPSATPLTYGGAAHSKLTAVKAQPGSLSAQIAVGTNPTTSVLTFCFP